MKYILGVILLIHSSFVLALNEDQILSNSFWKLDPHELWTYNETYGFSYIYDKESLIVVFKDEQSEYGLFVVNGDFSKYENYQYISINEQEALHFLAMNYGSGIILQAYNDKVTDLIKNIRTKETASITHSLFYNELVSFSLSNSYTSIGQLEPRLPLEILLADVYFNSDQFDDLIGFNIQLVNTSVILNEEYPNGYIEQDFIVMDNGHSDWESSIMELINYKKQLCSEQSYLWTKGITHKYKIDFKGSNQKKSLDVSDTCDK